MCMWWDKCTRLETVWFLQQAYSEQQHKWNSQQSRGEREKGEGRGEESMSRMEGGWHAYSMWQRERERGEEERRERYHQQQQQCSTKTKRTGKVWRERAREREKGEDEVWRRLSPLPQTWPRAHQWTGRNLDDPCLLLPLLLLPHTGAQPIECAYVCVSARVHSGIAMRFRDPLYHPCALACVLL